MNLFLLLIKRELALCLRSGFENIMVVIFFVLAVSLFPFGVSPELKTLAKIGPGIIWVAALFSVVLSLDSLFKPDFEDGSLELFATQPISLELIVLAKIIAHWSTTGLALIFSAPILCIIMNIQLVGYLPLIGSLFLGTPSLSLIGGMGASLIIGAKRSRFLLSLIILPLYIPVLIFSISIFEATMSGLPIQSHILFLSAIFLAALAVCPWVGASAIRQALNT